jgi:hypothetical protein
MFVMLANLNFFLNFVNFARYENTERHCPLRSCTCIFHLLSIRCTHMLQDSETGSNDISFGHIIFLSLPGGRLAIDCSVSAYVGLIFRIEKLKVAFLIN